MGQLEDRDPRRVVAAVFEPLQALHQDRGGFAIAQVADDSAHFFTSSRTPRAVVSTGTEGLTPRTAARLPRLGAGCDVRVLRDRIVDRGVGDIPAADSGRVWNGNLDGPVRGVAAEVDRRQRDPLD